jgi:hypothetical protein
MPLFPLVFVPYYYVGYLFIPRDILLSSSSKFASFPNPKELKIEEFPADSQPLSLEAPVRLSSNSEESSSSDEVAIVSDATTTSGGLIATSTTSNSGLRDDENRGDGVYDVSTVTDNNASLTKSADVIVKNSTRVSKDANDSIVNVSNVISNAKSGNKAKYASSAVSVITMSFLTPSTQSPSPPIRRSSNDFEDDELGNSNLTGLDHNSPTKLISKSVATMSETLVPESPTNSLNLMGISISSGELEAVGEKQQTYSSPVHNDSSRERVVLHINDDENEPSDIGHVIIDPDCEFERDRGNCSLPVDLNELALDDEDWQENDLRKNSKSVDSKNGGGEIAMRPNLLKHKYNGSFNSNASAIPAASNLLFGESSILVEKRGMSVKMKSGVVQGTSRASQEDSSLSERNAMSSKPKESNKKKSNSSKKKSTVIGIEKGEKGGKGEKRNAISKAPSVASKPKKTTSVKVTNTTNNVGVSNKRMKLSSEKAVFESNNNNSTTFNSNNNNHRSNPSCVKVNPANNAIDRGENRRVESPVVLSQDSEESNEFEEEFCIRSRKVASEKMAVEIENRIESKIEREMEKVKESRISLTCLNLVSPMTPKARKRLNVGVDGRIAKAHNFDALDFDSDELSVFQYLNDMGDNGEQLGDDNENGLEGNSMNVENDNNNNNDRPLHSIEANWGILVVDEEEEIEGEKSIDLGDPVSLFPSASSFAIHNDNTDNQSANRSLAPKSSNIETLDMSDDPVSSSCDDSDDDIVIFDIDSWRPSQSDLSQNPQNNSRNSVNSNLNSNNSTNNNRNSSNNNMATFSPVLLSQTSLTGSTGVSRFVDFSDLLSNKNSRTNDTSRQSNMNNFSNNATSISGNSNTSVPKNSNPFARTKQPQVNDNLNSSSSQLPSLVSPLPSQQQQSTATQTNVTSSTLRPDFAKFTIDELKVRSRSVCYVVLIVLIDLFYIVFVVDSILIISPGVS